MENYFFIITHFIEKQITSKTTNKTVIIAETATITRPGNHRVNYGLYHSQYQQGNHCC